VKCILHICWGLEPTNGAANIARLIMGEQLRCGGKGEDGEKLGGTRLSRPHAEMKSWLSVRDIKLADEVWCHCGWYYGVWWAVAWSKLFKKRICWVPECCYDPVRLAYHGWKKRLVGPVERWALRQCDEIVATCATEAEWVRAYEPRVKKVVVTDVKRFFKFDEAGCAAKISELESRAGKRPLRVLFLGREHPLKGTEYLKKAVEEINAVPSANSHLPTRIDLKTASAAHGEEKESLWRWADVFVLPTLSDNFGLVIAEALERGVPVVTTDGAPAWDPVASLRHPSALNRQPPTCSSAPQPSVVYLRGYRDGTPETRVRLLKNALVRFGA